MIVADESSNIKVVLWDTNHIELIEKKIVQEGTVIEISGGSMRDNEIHLGSFSEFKVSKENLENVKNTFDVDVVYLCVILQAEIKRVDSKHWKPIFKIVNNKRNKNKYLLNGFQFIKLVNDIYKNSNLKKNRFSKYLSVTVF